jgi:hypothetical protein
MLLQQPTISNKSRGLREWRLEVRRQRGTSQAQTLLIMRSPKKSSSIEVTMLHCPPGLKCKDHRQAGVSSTTIISQHLGSFVRKHLFMTYANLQMSIHTFLPHSTALKLSSSPKVLKIRGSINIGGDSYTRNVGYGLAGNRQSYLGFFHHQIPGDTERRWGGVWSLLESCLSGLSPKRREASPARCPCVCVYPTRARHRAIKCSPNVAHFISPAQQPIPVRHASICGLLGEGRRAT